jgi:hypothetical protein
MAKSRISRKRYTRKHRKNVVKNRSNKIGGGTKYGYESICDGTKKKAPKQWSFKGMLGLRSRSVDLPSINTDGKIEGVTYNYLNSWSEKSGPLEKYEKSMQTRYKLNLKAKQNAESLKEELEKNPEFRERYEIHKKFNSYTKDELIDVLKELESHSVDIGKSTNPTLPGTNGDGNFKDKTVEELREQLKDIYFYLAKRDYNMINYNMKRYRETRENEHLYRQTDNPSLDILKDLSINHWNSVAANTNHYYSSDYV